MTDVDFDSLPSEEPTEDAPPGLLLCPECGKECKNQRGLSMHMKRTHQVESDKEDAKPASLRKSNLEKDLAEFFMMIAMMVSMVNANDGAIIGQNSERLAHAYGNLAKQNKAFRRFLEGMMKTGAMGEVFTATLFTAIPILGNHGKLPPELMIFFGGATGAPPMEQG